MKITRRRKTNKRGSRKTNKRGTRKGLRSKLRGVGGSPHKGVGLGLGRGSRPRNVLQTSYANPVQGDEEPIFEYPEDSEFERERESLIRKQSLNMSKKLYSELIKTIREIFNMSMNSDKNLTQAITGTPAQLKAQIAKLHEKAQAAIYKPNLFFSKSSQAKSFEKLKAKEAELYAELYAELNAKL